VTEWRDTEGNFLLDGGSHERSEKWQQRGISTVPAAGAERPLSVQSEDLRRDAYVDGPRLARPAARNDVLVDCSHMSGLCVRHGWPLAQMGCADRVSNTAVMSKKHHRVPRVIPILGPTDRHLAAVLASARAMMRCAAQTACGWR